MDLEDMPQEFKTLSQWLVSTGFGRQDHGYDRSFGDRMIEFRRDDLVVRLVRDRGNWLLALGGQQAETRFDVGVWRAYLRGTEASTSETRTSHNDAEFVRRHLPEVEIALRSDPELSARLRALGSKRNRKIVGLE